MLPFDYDIKEEKYKANLALAQYVLQDKNELEDYYENLETNLVPRDECVYYQALKAVALQAYDCGKLQDEGVWKVTFRLNGELQFLWAGTLGQSPTEGSIDLYVKSEADLIEWLVSDTPCGHGELVMFQANIGDCLREDDDISSVHAN